MSSRRAFLLRSAQVVGGLLLLDVSGCAGPEPMDTRVAVDVALLLPGGAATLGKLWLDEQPADREALALALFPDGPPPPGSDPKALAHSLAARVAEEHRGGAARSLRGWRLAPTELTLCALAALG